MLQPGQAFQQPRATPMNEQRRANARIDIAEPLQDFSPAVDPC
jgi:hypothetical protein